MRNYNLKLLVAGLLLLGGCTNTGSSGSGEGLNKILLCCKSKESVTNRQYSVSVAYKDKIITNITQLSYSTKKLV